MIPKGLFTQIAMLIVSVSIVFTYVRPAFGEIGKVQDDIDVYVTERQKVTSVNSTLAGLLSKMNSISNDDRRRLYSYLPDEVDDIAVLRDLAIISLQAGVLYKNASFIGAEDDSTSRKNETVVGPQAHTFALSIEGTYDQIKNLLRLMEQNNYPLEIRNLSIVGTNGDFLEANMQLYVYAYRAPDDAKN